MKNMRHTKQRFSSLVRSLLLYCFLGINFAFSAMASHQGPSVILVADGNADLMQTFATELANNLKQHDIDLSSITIDNAASLSNENFYTYDLIITLGTSAADKIIEKNINKPVLSTLIPQQTFEAISSRNTFTNSWSALLIDQPVKRQLLLIKHLFGKPQTVGTILGPYSAPMEKELNNQSRILKQRLVVEKINTTDELGMSLNKLSNNTEVLLAIPDPVAFNRTTIRSILLSTYRHKIPVIGFSQSYVKAGAIAAIHTDIPQLAQQAAEIIRQFIANGSFSRNFYYPNQFTISYNKMVADSLNQALPDSEKLIELIKQDEDRP